MSEELKPCPFCGMPDPDLLKVARADDLWFRVVCRRCDSGTPAHFLAKKDAEAVWNNRPALTPEDEQAISVIEVRHGETEAFLRQRDKPAPECHYDRAILLGMIRRRTP